MLRSFVYPAGLALWLAGGTPGLLIASQATGADEALVDRARAIHDRIITLDAHIDMNPVNFTAERNYTQDLGIQADLPKMREGGLDASFFVVYVPQRDLTPSGFARAYEAAVEKFDAIHRLTGEYAPDQIELALTPADVRRIEADGKIAALIGVENGYPIGDDLGRIAEFYDRGARYMGLAHNGHNQLADSNTGEEDGVWMHDGLSPAGAEAVAELNRLGMMVDVSHMSRQAMMEAIGASAAPVIASHSSVRALVDHARNLDDGQLRALMQNGGVVQVVAYPMFVKTRESESAERAEAIEALRQSFGLGDASAPGAARRFEQVWNTMTAEQRAAYLEDRDDIDDRFPRDPPASVADFIDHIDYAVDLIGIDHVGIASDFNNGEGVTGWFDAGETFNVTLELVRRGYTEDQIEKLWSGNLLRVMDEAQRIGRQLSQQ